MTETVQPHVDQLMDNLERSQAIARIAARISSDPAYTLLEAKRDFQILPMNGSTPQELADFELQFGIIENYLSHPANLAAINLNRSTEDLLSELNIVNSYLVLRHLDVKGRSAEPLDFSPLRQYYKKFLNPLLSNPDPQISRIAAQIVEHAGEVIKIELPSGETTEVHSSSEIIGLVKDLLAHATH